MQVTCMSQMAFHQWFSITPRESWLRQLPNGLDRRERCQTACCSSTAMNPPLPGPTDLFCCVTVNGRSSWLCSSSECWTGKEYSVSSNPPQFASTPKETLEQGSIPKAFLWNVMTVAVPLTDYPGPITTVWSITWWPLVCMDRSNTQNIPLSMPRKAFQNITKYVQVPVTTFFFSPVHFLKCIQQAKTYKKKRWIERSEANMRKNGTGALRDRGKISSIFQCSPFCFL